jgi:hypothetical protein
VSHPSVREVERLLRESGIQGAERPTGRARRAPRSPLARFARRLLLRIALALLCVVLALSGLLRWSTGTASEPLTPPGGAQIGPPHAVDARFGIVQAFQDPRAAQTVPIGWERMVFYWKELQPDGPDSWNAFATNHDQAINQEVQAGRQVVGLLINTPDWAAADPAAHGDSPPKGLYLPYDDPDNYWGHFVGLMAKRYAGRIDDWIIWNEVNIPSGPSHTWAGSRADYAQMVKVAYLAATAANPKARIVLAGDPYWYDHGAWFADLLHRLSTGPGARANHDYFDVVNLHLYSGPLGFVHVIDWYKATLARYGLSRPIWIAETNALPYDDSARSYPRSDYRVSVDDQASYMVQAFAIDLASGVQRIEVNRMLDGPEFAAGGDPYGLIRNDGTPRPAFFAYRAVASLFAGATAERMQLSDPRGVATVVLRRAGERITVVWDERPTATTIALPASAGRAMLYDKFGQGRSIAASRGRYVLQLTGARANTDPVNPKAYVVGGSPWILVEAA